MIMAFVQFRSLIISVDNTTWHWELMRGLSGQHDVLLLFDCKTKCITTYLNEVLFGIKNLQEIQIMSLPNLLYMFLQKEYELLFQAQISSAN